MLLSKCNSLNKVFGFYMENYEVLSVAGEGSYGIVMKCRHRHTKKIFAIKKITDYNNDNYVKKMILREVRILKKIRHENLVQLFEVFKKKRRFYLVFEYLEKTVLDDLENNPKGLGKQQTLEYIYQLIRAVEFCHTRNIIHRDIKPENLLISSTGILKLCDFGCARLVSNHQDCICTEYVATRWYRAPELLVRDRKYGKPVDIWAIGCVLVEILNGEPLFPGQSDVDQLYMIMKCFGQLCARHQQILSSSDLQYKNNKSSNDLEKYSKNSMNSFHALHKLFPSWSINTINLAALCLNLDPEKRASAVQLLHNEYFKAKNIHEEWFASLLQKTEDNLKSRSKPEIKYNMEFLTENSTLCNFSRGKKSSSDHEEKRLFDENNSNLKVKSPDKKSSSLSSLTHVSSSNTIISKELHSNINADLSPKKEYWCLPANEKITGFLPQSPLFSFHQPLSPLNRRYASSNESNRSKRDECTKQKMKYENLKTIKKDDITQNKNEFSSVSDLSLPYLKNKVK